MTKGVVGADLSLSRTGLCCIPPDWEGDIGSLKFESIETRRAELAYGKPHILARIDIERYLQIAESVIGFVKVCEVSDIAVENYSYSPVKDKKGRPVQSASVTKLAELGGVIKSQIMLACKVVMVPVAANTARKFLTGGLKRGKQKQQVERFMKERGFVFGNWDEMDSFVIAYYWYGQVNNLRSKFLPQSEMDFGI